jgi:ribosomal protein S18 acetylase RimI-like enzyme
MQDPWCRIRPLRPDDAQAVSALYREEYGGTRGRYPFVQFLDDAWVASAAHQKDLCWLVAETEAGIGGTLGAVTNIGGPQDRIAELFGLVVSRLARRRGIASALAAELRRRLADRCDVLIAATRTAEPGGWSALRKLDFVPIGLEPQAHRTPAGWEPMLVLAYVAPRALAARAVGAATGLPVRTLGRAVSKLFGSGETACGPFGVAGRPRSTTARMPLRGGLTFERADNAGEQLHHDLRHILGRHESGILDLDRLRGYDPARRRYTDAYLLMRSGAQAVACARLQWDRHDRRLRVLSLERQHSSFVEPLLRAVVRWGRVQSARGPFSVVVDVRADAPGCAGALERLGFFPTLYCPAMIAEDGRRGDAVQYTLLRGCSLAATWAFTRNVQWREAQSAIRGVFAAARAQALQQWRTAALRDRPRPSSSAAASEG